MTLQVTLLILKLISVLKFTKSELTGFIVGGKYSKILEFPYAAYVTISCNDKHSSCGASILNQELLLTAAHCVYECNNNNFTIMAFTGSEYKFEGFANKVVKYRINKKYNDYNCANDVAILKLKNDITFGANVKRIALIKKTPKYSNAVVAGWGWIDSMGTQSYILKHTSQRVYSRRACIKILKKIPDGTICGREVKGQSYPERGDSGSALVVHNFIQIGIVSYKHMDLSNETIVYSNVPYYYGWIKKNAKELYCDGKSKTSLRIGNRKKTEEKKWNTGTGNSYHFSKKCLLRL